MYHCLTFPTLTCFRYSFWEKFKMFIDHSVFNTEHFLDLSNCQITINHATEDIQEQSKIIHPT